MKCILFRIPKDLAEDLKVELEFRNTNGQHFVEELIWDKLFSVRRDKATERNFKNETREDIRKKLFKPKTKLRKKESSARGAPARLDE